MLFFVLLCDDSRPPEQNPTQKAVEKSGAPKKTNTHATSSNIPLLPSSADGAREIRIKPIVYSTQQPVKAVSMHFCAPSPVFARVPVVSASRISILRRRQSKRIDRQTLGLCVCLQSNCSHVILMTRKIGGLWQNRHTGKKKKPIQSMAIESNGAYRRQRTHNVLCKFSFIFALFTVTFPESFTWIFFLSLARRSLCSVQSHSPSNIFPIVVVVVVFFYWNSSIRNQKIYLYRINRGVHSHFHCRARSRDWCR